MPFEDVVRLFPTTKDCNKYILSAMDYFNKWPEAYAILKQEEFIIPRALTNLFSKFRVPFNLYPNQEGNCKSADLKESATCWIFERPGPHHFIHSL